MCVAEPLPSALMRAAAVSPPSSFDGCDESTPTGSLCSSALLALLARNAALQPSLLRTRPADTAAQRVAALQARLRAEAASSHAVTRRCAAPAYGRCEREPVQQSDGDRKRAARAEADARRVHVTREYAAAARRAVQARRPSVHTVVAHPQPWAGCDADDSAGSVASRHEHCETDNPCNSDASSLALTSAPSPASTVQSSLEALHSDAQDGVHLSICFPAPALPLLQPEPVAVPVAAVDGFLVRVDVNTLDVACQTMSVSAGSTARSPPEDDSGSDDCTAWTRDEQARALDSECSSSSSHFSSASLLAAPSAPLGLRQLELAPVSSASFFKARTALLARLRLQRRRVSSTRHGFCIDGPVVLHDAWLEPDTCAAASQSLLLPELEEDDAVVNSTEQLDHEAALSCAVDARDAAPVPTSPSIAGLEAHLAPNVVATGAGASTFAAAEAVYDVAPAALNPPDEKALMDTCGKPLHASATTADMTLSSSLMEPPLLAAHRVEQAHTLELRDEPGCLPAGLASPGALHPESRTVFDAERAARFTDAVLQHVAQEQARGQLLDVHSGLPLDVLHSVDDATDGPCRALRRLVFDGLNEALSLQALDTHAVSTALWNHRLANLSNDENRQVVSRTLRRFLEAWAAASSADDAVVRVERQLLCELDADERRWHAAVHSELAMLEATAAEAIFDAVLHRVVLQVAADELAPA